MKWSSLGLRAPKQTLDILGLPHIYSRFRHHARWASLGAAMATSSSRISHFLRSLLLFGFIHFYFHQALERWWRDECPSRWGKPYDQGSVYVSVGSCTSKGTHQFSSGVCRVAKFPASSWVAYPALFWCFGGSKPLAKFLNQVANLLHCIHDSNGHRVGG